MKPFRIKMAHQLIVNYGLYRRMNCYVSFIQDNSFSCHIEQLTLRCLPFTHLSILLILNKLRLLFLKKTPTSRPIKIAH